VTRGRYTLTGRRRGGAVFWYGKKLDTAFGSLALTACKFGVESFNFTFKLVFTINLGLHKCLKFGYLLVELNNAMS
jgi:hypothetical protein